MAQNIFIVAAKRTAFGTFGGSLRDLTATELGSVAAKGALSTLPPNLPIDSIIFGNVSQTDSTAPYLARHVGHRTGLPIHVPALTLNRLCGSGFQTVISAIQEIRSGDSNIVLTGGTENMSKSPYKLNNIRWGTTFGLDLTLEDSLAITLVDHYPTKTPMGVTAENLAKIYKITREQADEYALSSQKRWAAGYFENEIVPIELKLRKGQIKVFKTDEHPRPQTEIQSLQKLSPVFIKDTGTVTAGNASGISDGAGAVVVASESAVEEHKLTPLARIVSYHVSGVEPTIMGIGPVPAIKNALDKSGLKLSNMDLIEVNEAFAAQYLAVEKELGLDRNEKIESENREYYINKIKDLIEESDLNVNYSMEKINSGEFSEVFKATHKITNKVIVIKSISIRDSKFLNILYNEVLISKVARHSNIIINYTQYIKKDHIYLLMEHCEFGSLYNIRNKKPNKKMNEKEVSFIVKEVLKGLNHLHSIGFIHRDIKAQNILVNSEGKIKIELLQNKIYSNKIDIWSLGITAVELFDGKPPWYPMNKNRVIELIKSVGLPPLPSNISPGFESYLKHSFTSNP
ncbi:6696_t:CDS:2, partial [Entrophospora sp. SA101]